jgi:hypothetical protein
MAGLSFMRSASVDAPPVAACSSSANCGATSCNTTAHGHKTIRVSTRHPVLVTFGIRRRHAVRVTSDTIPRGLHGLCAWNCLAGAPVAQPAGRGSWTSRSLYALPSVHQSP